MPNMWTLLMSYIAHVSTKQGTQGAEYNIQTFRNVYSTVYGFTRCYGADSSHDQETPGRTPSLFNKRTGLFYIRYTTHVTNGLTSHPKDEAMVKSVFLKDTSVTVGDSNPHSADQRFWDIAENTERIYPRRKNTS